MNKSEIQARIEKCESDPATLKADLAKCDCAEGIEQEKCWYAKDVAGEVRSAKPLTKYEVETGPNFFQRRPAYMPECRRVAAEDAGLIPYFINVSNDELALALHKLGFRMKVTP